MKNNTYSNGQKAHEKVGDLLTYYFKNGNIRAQGLSQNEVMEGEWIFYRQTGQKWQVGNFKDGLKHGPWIRYNKKEVLDYQETFNVGVIVQR